MNRLAISKIIYLFVLIFVGQSVFADKLSREQYIKKFAKIAVKEMNTYHIPASITLAQGCLESGNGNSTLAQKSNNHFGIKCGSTWTGKKVYHDDDRRHECFRKYRDPEESYRDHSEFLTGKDRYASLFHLKITDYKGWAKGLKKAGYATDPHYPTRLIQIIEENKLYAFDRYYKKKYTPTTPENSPKPIAPKVDLSDRERQLIASCHFEPQKYSKRGDRKKLKRNGIKSVLAEAGDSYQSIATEFNRKDWEVCNYNEVPMSKLPTPGMVVYLGPKRLRAALGNEFHEVLSGESIWFIAQKYGITVGTIYRLNRMKKGDKIRVGQKLWLRDKKPRG